MISAPVVFKWNAKLNDISVMFTNFINKNPKGMPSSLHYHWIPGLVYCLNDQYFKGEAKDNSFTTKIAYLKPKTKIAYLKLRWKCSPLKFQLVEFHHQNWSWYCLSLSRISCQYLLQLMIVNLFKFLISPIFLFCIIGVKAVVCKNISLLRLVCLI